MQSPGKVWVLRVLDGLRRRLCRRHLSSLSCVNCQPNRPLMHKFPCVTELSSGELTFTICPACACTVSSHPTPQYGQIVSVRVCCSSFQVPAARMSYSVLNISAPVGHTPMQLPQ